MFDVEVADLLDFTTPVIKIEVRFVVGVNIVCSLFAAAVTVPSQCINDPTAFAPSPCKRPCGVVVPMPTLPAVGCRIT